jgi:hypothetical protein
MLLDVLAVVEVDEHSGILQDPDQQSAEVARGVRAKHLVLPEHHPVVAHLVLAGREVAVPEERQLLFERPAGGEHLFRPPQAQTLRFNAVGREAVEELVDDRLEPALRSLRSNLLSEALTALTGYPYRFCAAGREGVHARIPDTGLVEGLQIARDRFVIDEGVDRLPRGHRGQARDLLRRAAESGAFEEVGRPLGVPVRRDDGCEVVGPLDRRHSRRPSRRNGA